MHKSPLISIIVPVYNVKEFLVECIESLIAQTYENLEIIIVDDGSTDGSSELCDKLKYKDKRIVVIHQKNGGLSAARNSGLKIAEGEYVAFVDSDDSANPSFIKVLFRAAKTHNSDIVVCGYDDNFPKEKTLTGKEATINLLLAQENIDILAWNKLYKKALFTDNHIKYPTGKIHEDNLTTYKLYSKSNKVSFISESLYNYRKRKGSITNKDKKELHLEIREFAAREAISYFANDSELKSAAEISLLLAKFAFLDNALNKRIDQKRIAKTISWLKTHKKEFHNNVFLSTKLKAYLVISTNFNGFGYKLFRKIKHE